VGTARKLLDGNGHNVAIKWKSNYSVHKTLGCYIKAARTGRSMVSSDTKWRIPSLGQFLEVENEEEFGSLKANDVTEEGEDKTPNFFKMPNHAFGCPFMMFALEGRGSIGAG
jgi:hypothetical protein